MPQHQAIVMFVLTALHIMTALIKRQQHHVQLISILLLDGENAGLALLE